MKLRRTFAALAAVMSGTAGTLAVAAPAMAGTFCPYDYICMWEDPAWSGSEYIKVRAVPGSYGIDGWDGDNEISSIINESRKYCVTLYNNDNWTGSTYRLSYDGSNPRLSNANFDNKAESFKIHSC
ncbi:peptidase inhibitor family I36 protein [Krasilnikovia sp. M28-CT-15]|uniref:peptidase inhibitor family I36 protein n=1 Tax=Krasilnikovia sp. M28-CT-15 TaxID=3373540 RepID=UPI003876F7AD